MIYKKNYNWSKFNEKWTSIIEKLFIFYWTHVSPKNRFGFLLDARFVSFSEKPTTSYSTMMIHKSNNVIEKWNGLQFQFVLISYLYS